ncbi:WPE palindromic element domain-containing protein [Wolbachia endosymbiont (group B) of Germaria angustata]|uniref:WPE palindromic element domain-containing protein n=1 Tax=Wolbachia endosymbiont (group B) of Germaria angustata TaxID=3077916 RepID=UPI003132D490
MMEKWIPVLRHWDDKKRSTGMTRRTFHHVIPAHDAGIQKKEQWIPVSATWMTL